MLPVSVLVSCPDTVLMIDTVGTFNAIKAAYEVYMKVSLAWPGMVCCVLCALPPRIMVELSSISQQHSTTLGHLCRHTLALPRQLLVGWKNLSVCMCLSIMIHLSWYRCPDKASSSRVGTAGYQSQLYCSWSNRRHRRDEEAW